MVGGLLALKDKALDNAFVSKAVRGLFGFDSQKKILDLVKKELNAQIHEKILDVGCGLGRFSEVTDGEYVGIDMNPSFLKYAAGHYASGGKKFVLMDAQNMKFEDKSFDKSLFITVLHHFSDEESGRVLGEIARVTRKSLVIMDDLPTKKVCANFLYAMDKGRYMRPKERQYELIGKYFEIKKYEEFDFALFSNSLMVCAPIKGAV